MREETKQLKEFLNHYSANLSTERMDEICQKVEERRNLVEFFKFRLLEKTGEIEDNIFLSFIENKLLAEKERKIMRLRSQLKYEREERSESGKILYDKVDKLTSKLELVKKKLTEWNSLLIKHD